jgi:hypothetical protein
VKGTAFEPRSPGSYGLNSRVRLIGWSVLRVCDWLERIACVCVRVRSLARALLRSRDRRSRRGFGRAKLTTARGRTRTDRDRSESIDRPITHAVSLSPQHPPRRQEEAGDTHTRWAGRRRRLLLLDTTTAGTTVVVSATHTHPYLPSRCCSTPCSSASSSRWGARSVTGGRCHQPE